MNIFVLDHNPELCAQYHCDKHVVKMILEYAQLLSTAHRILDGRDVPKHSYDDNGKLKTKMVRLLGYETVTDMGPLYKVTHVNHPCSIWVRTAVGNYKYVFDLLIALLREYTHRYGKVHATSRLVPALSKFPTKFPDLRIWTTPFALAMPDHCKVDGTVDSYRRYYVMEKESLLKYTKRKEPFWVSDFRESINSSI